MEVINLGNFGQRRPSQLEGMSNALQAGLRTGVEQGKSLAEIKNMEASRAYQQQEMKIKQAELSRQIDKDTMEKEIKQAEHGLVIADNLKMRLDSMDPTMKAITMESPSIKAITDNLKKTNPELFDDKGAFVGRSTETMIKAQAEQHRNQAIQTVEALTRKSQAQGGLSQEDMTAMQSAVLTTKLLHNSNMDDISSFVKGHYSKKSSQEDMAKDAQNQPWYQGIANIFKTPVAQAAPAPTSAVPMAPQAPVPAQGGGNTANPNDPLNARSV